MISLYFYANNDNMQRVTVSAIEKCWIRNLKPNAKSAGMARGSHRVT